jgi:hypothetical protein
MKKKKIYQLTCQKIHSGVQKTNPKTISENGLFFVKEDMNTYTYILMFSYLLYASYCIVLHGNGGNKLFAYVFVFVYLLLQVSLLLLTSVMFLLSLLLSLMF